MYLSKFVRLYDGANFHKADGRGMHSGESELIRFNHIAAIPKFSKEIMAAFAHLGNRIFLLRIEPPSLTYAETVQTAMKILENRVKKARLLMDKNHIDLLLITSPHNFRYFSGLDSYYC